MPDRGVHDVVVVGAGVVGCAAARELAPDHDVVVVDEGPIAGGATGKASGLISTFYDYRDHLDAAAYAMDFFDAYADAVTYRRRPNLFLVTGDEAAAARRVADRVADAGFAADYLSPAEVEARHPDAVVLDEFAGAVAFDAGGWVDPHALAVAFQADAAADGATFETGTRVEGIPTEGGAVRGVETDAGRIHADTVVCAAGWRTRELVPVDLPIRPFRYQTATLATDRSFDDRFPIAWEHRTRLYWRPTPTGDLHVGGAPYFVSTPGRVRTDATAAFRELVAATMPMRVPGLDDARLVAGDTCPRGDGATPDTYPILDAPADGPDGLVVATGMHGFGIMASPVAAAAVRSLVADEKPPFPIEPFGLDRFEDRSTDFGSDYIAASAASLPSP